MAVEDFSSSYNLSLNWPWGLGPFREDITNTSIPSLSVFVDDEGVVQFLNRLYSYAPADPIDCATIPTFSKDNNFIAGVESAITTVPTYGIICYPTILPGTKNNPVKYPTHTPPGYFPLIGRRVRGPEGESYTLPFAASPVLSNFTPGVDGAGDPLPPSYTEAPFRYMMKLGVGWTFEENIFPRGVDSWPLEKINEFGGFVFSD